METSGSLPSLRPRTVTSVLSAAAFLVVLAHVLVVLFKYQANLPSWDGLVALFDLDEERNVPTYFSCCLLVLASILLAVIASLEVRSARWPWHLLSGGFFVMGMEEFMGLHEKIAKPLRKFLDIQSGLFYFAWTLPAILLVLILGLILFRFFWRLPQKTRLLFGISGFLYVGAAIGLELLESSLYQPGLRLQSLPYILVSALEETSEMAAVILFIHAMLLYLSSRFGKLEIRFLK